jgi:hypothetical protein
MHANLHVSSHRVSRPTFSKWIAVGLMMVLAGCGGGAANKPKLVTVKGRLVSQIGAPVANARIEFLPSKGAPSAATTDASGNFVLSYVDGTHGAIAGTHQVRITIGSSPMGDGGDSRPVAASQPAAAAKPPMLYILPQVTIETETTALELKLPEKGQMG